MMTIVAGTKLGRYEILSKIGEGGMGEVYLAEDTKLDRKVALKILPADVASNQERMRRFIQEAKAASALNHPNILTIYEIDQADCGHFIATEFIDGETLRERMKSAPLKLGEVLDVAAHIASALSAAHAAGIVHRDIKPENIMLRRDGIVKVLDFGLAKLTVSQPAAVDTEAATKALFRTDPGVVVGTATYMSPEQARGIDVDTRTDIFSFGIVLYEMIAGRPPFAGNTPTEVIAAIINHEPPLLARYSREVPERFEWVVAKTLRKDRDERYQTPKELLSDLRQLQQRLAFSAEQERSLASDLSPEPSAQTSAMKRLAEVDGIFPTQTSPGPTYGAESIVSQIKRHKRGAMFTVALVAVAMTAISVGVYKWVRPKQTALSFASAKITRLTSTGKTTGAAISPDGKWLVHVQDDVQRQSLWLRQVAITNSNTQIVPPAEVHYYGLAFSPDGNYVYYTASDEKNLSGLYQIPVLGGTARKLPTAVDSSVAFSPEGNLIAYFFHYEDEDRLMIAKADGTGERQLAMRRGNESFLAAEFSGLSWSPDGKILASPVGNQSENYMSVATVSVDSGEIKFFTPQRWRTVGQVAWLADGKSILVTAREQGSSSFQLWQVSYPSGQAQRITNDLSSYPYVGLTADGSLLVAVQYEAVANIWMAPISDTTRATQITEGRNLNLEASWAPDGKIVYSSNAHGTFDLYLTDTSRGSPQQLTFSAGRNRNPLVTPNGSYIVFVSDRTGVPRIWRMDMEGGNVKQLTDKYDFQPECSPDGQWIIYASNANKSTIWKVSIDGGRPVQLTEKTSFSPTFSPDGNQIACFYQEEPNSAIKLAILPSEGGKPTKIIAGAKSEVNINLRWTPDGRAIVYGATPGGITNLWAQPIDGSQPKQLTKFTSDRIYSFDFSGDGKQIALSRGIETSDVVLFSNFR